MLRDSCFSCTIKPWFWNTSKCIPKSGFSCILCYIFLLSSQCNELDILIDDVTMCAFEFDQVNSRTYVICPQVYIPIWSVQFICGATCWNFKNRQVFVNMAGEKFDYKQFQLESWDYVVLVIYFISVLFVGIWVSKTIEEGEFIKVDFR